MYLMKRKILFKKWKILSNFILLEHGIDIPMKINNITTVIILKNNIRKKVITFYKIKIKK